MMKNSKPEDPFYSLSFWEENKSRLMGCGSKSLGWGRSNNKIPAGSCPTPGLSLWHRRDCGPRPRCSIGSALATPGQRMALGAHDCAAGLKVALPELTCLRIANRGGHSPVPAGPTGSGLDSTITYRSSCHQLTPIVIPTFATLNLALDRCKVTSWHARTAFSLDVLRLLPERVITRQGAESESGRIYPHALSALGAHRRWLAMPSGRVSSEQQPAPGWVYYEHPSPAEEDGMYEDVVPGEGFIDPRCLQMGASPATSALLSHSAGLVGDLNPTDAQHHAPLTLSSTYVHGNSQTYGSTNDYDFAEDQLQLSQGSDFAPAPSF
ncbi:hypothetical protein QBC40DRAFT_345306, partial [Triangularia verruculosa]